MERDKVFIPMHRQESSNPDEDDGAESDDDL